MKIQLNTDDHIDGTETLPAQGSATIEHALARFDQPVTRLVVHLSDENAGKNSQRDQRCRLESRLEGRQPAVVTDQAAKMQQAVHGAAQNRAHLLDKTLERLSGQREKTSGVPLSVIKSATR